MLLTIRKRTVTTMMVLAVLLERSVTCFKPGYTSRGALSRCRYAHHQASSIRKSTEESSTSDDITNHNNNEDVVTVPPVPLYRAEGLFAVHKPLDWTSSNVVSYIRGILERDARNRGAKPEKLGRRKVQNDRKIKVGHGGTLDPLATGVLVIGVGKGTKQLER